METNAASSPDAEMADPPEESSWTFYIQGFMCDNDDDEDKNTSFSSIFESPSLVSDADSSAVKKFSTDHSNVGFSSGESNIPHSETLCMQNGFKKQKTKFIPAMEYDLEDTASSPVNSPKVTRVNPFKDQKEKAKMDVPEAKRNILAKGGVFAVGGDANCTDSKKRTCG